MTEEHQEDTGTYELAFVLEAPEGEAVISQAIAASGGTVAMRGPVRQTRLAYPIRKLSSGYFGYVHFTAPRAAVDGISKTLTLAKGVLRFLVVSSPHKVPMRENRFAPRSAEPEPAAKPEILSNEALEAKLEEILK